MIARIWRGVTLESDGEHYFDYLTQTGLKDYQSTAGNRGVMILRRVHNDRAEFLLISLWDSFDSIRNFAGPDTERALYYPEDKTFLLEMEPHVLHFEVLFDSAGEAKHQRETDRRCR